MIRVLQNRRYPCAPILSILLIGLPICLRGDDLGGEEVALVVRVEEDWELVIATPNTNMSGPQVTCISSPFGNLKGLSSSLRLNHQIVDKFVPGGLQLNLVKQEFVTQSVESANPRVLSYANETIRWTQVMYIKNGQLTIEIRNGQSTSLGAFGALGALRITVPTTENSLNGYDPEVAVKNSVIGFGSNRVTSLAIKQVRCFTSNDQVLIDKTEHTLHKK